MRSGFVLQSRLIRRIVTVENPHFEAGQLSSLKVGLGAVGNDCRGVLVHLADHPLVQPSTFQSVVAQFVRGRGAIVIARCAGKRGHPVVFGDSVFRELLEAPAEQGARAVVIRDPARVVYVDVDDPGVTLDLDTPADVERAGLQAAAAQPELKLAHVRSGSYRCRWRGVVNPRVGGQTLRFAGLHWRRRPRTACG